MAILLHSGKVLQNSPKWMQFSEQISCNLGGQAFYPRETSVTRFSLGRRSLDNPGFDVGDLPIGKFVGEEVLLI